MTKFKSTVSDSEEIYEHIGTTNDLIIYSLCGITNPDPSYEVIREKSNCYSIEYIMEGEGVIQEDSKIYKVSKGDFFILHPEKFQHYYSSPQNPWKKIWLHITKGSYYTTTLLKLYDIEKQVVFKNINSPLNMESIFELHQSTHPKFRRELEIKLHEFIFDLSFKSQKRNATKTDLDNAKWYIDQNITSHLTVKDISKHIGMSYSYFSGTFKEKFNISPMQYIIREKINLAKHLLGSTDIPIPEISDYLSFSDLAHFSHTFQKHCGMSPSTYRQKAKELNLLQPEYHLI